MIEIDILLWAEKAGITHLIKRNNCGTYITPSKNVIKHSVPAKIGMTYQTTQLPQTSAMQAFHPAEQQYKLIHHTTGRKPSDNLRKTNIVKILWCKRGTIPATVSNTTQIALLYQSGLKEKHPKLCS